MACLLPVFCWSGTPTGVPLLVEKRIKRVPPASRRGAPIGDLRVLIPIDTPLRGAKNVLLILHSTDRVTPSGWLKSKQTILKWSHYIGICFTYTLYIIIIGIYRYDVNFFSAIYVFFQGARLVFGLIPGLFREFLRVCFLGHWSLFSGFGFLRLFCLELL